MNARFNFYFAVLFCCIVSFSHGNDKVKFGKVSAEELAMTEYAPEPNAEAVVLSDIGQFDINTYKFTRHLRVKILASSGLSLANWAFRTMTKADFSIMVFNLVEGEVTRVKATKENIFEEELYDEVTQYKVFAPNVKVGSVIDIKYSFLGLPTEWLFQDRIPIIYSDLSIPSNQSIGYSKLLQGTEKVESVSGSHWIARDMPSFKAEPYLSDHRNYLTKLEIQLEYFGRPGSSYFFAYSTSWDNIIDNLNDHSRFGTVYRSSPLFTQDVAAIKKANNDEVGRLLGALNFIRNHVHWDGRKELIASKDYLDIGSKGGTGSSADINLMFLRLLKKLGIEARPVVLSTNEHGYALEHHASIDQLNYVIVQVLLEDGPILIDASQKEMAPGDLPLYCLAGRGLVAQNNALEWIDLNVGAVKKTKSYLTIDLASQTAHVKSKYYGHDYYERVDKLQEPIQLKEELRAKIPSCPVNQYDIGKADASENVLEESAEIAIGSLIMQFEDEIIFNPCFIHPYSSSPFSATSRKFPIYFGPAIHTQTTIVLDIPTDKMVEAIPQSINLVNEDQSMKFKYLAQEALNTVQLMLTLDIEKSYYLEHTYYDVQAFFTAVAKKLNESIVLKDRRQE